jgi:hypothetical protein
LDSTKEGYASACLPESRVCLDLIQFARRLTQIFELSDWLFKIYALKEPGAKSSKLALEQNQIQSDLSAIVLKLSNCLTSISKFHSNWLPES